MTLLALSTGASWALVISLWLPIAIGVAITFGRVTHSAEQIERAERKELQGSIESLVEQQRRKADRAEFRHAVRHSRRMP